MIIHFANNFSSTEFIVICKLNKYLYNLRSKNNASKGKRNANYKLFLQVLQKIDPEATLGVLKISNN